jgi:signal transduction histidine kinase
MLQGAVSERRSLPVGSLLSMQRDHPILPQIVALKRLIAFISHDLRQPLAAILANAEFLTQPDIGRTQKVDLYREIRSDVDRINELVASLLEGSKGRDTLQPAVRNIVHTVESAIRSISINYRHKGRAVGWFDANRLGRVVVNLVLNACEAVDPASGQIVITTTGDRDSLQIAVWDNGPGIPSTIRDSVFQPFVSYGKDDGNGLGLAIAKKIVEDHGGSIGLEERTETGTLFKITIPFAIRR